MKQIDLEPDGYETKLDHETLNARHVFEVKPFPRWKFFVLLAMLIACAITLYPNDYMVWVVSVCGVAVGATMVITFPKLLLSRLRD